MKKLSVSMEEVVDQLIVDYQFDKDGYKNILRFTQCLFAGHEDELTEMIAEKARAKGLIK